MNTELRSILEALLWSFIIGLVGSIIGGTLITTAENIQSNFSPVFAVAGMSVAFSVIRNYNYQDLETTIVAAIMGSAGSYLGWRAFGVLIGLLIK